MKLLVVVDMQKDFVDGALGTSEAVAIVPRVQEKIAARQAAGWTTVFTRDTHTEQYLDTQEGRKLPVPHCIQGTPGWEIIPELPTQGCLILDKPSFGSLELARYAAQLENLEEIELVGLCTDICVISNALLLKAAVPEVPIYVDASCCAGVTPDSHANALRAMEMCQINVE
ncbi:MAG: cysteine hydrolase [Clostridiales bacterium]|nr:cysteine hydrolase [Clostridiales bacterium]